MFNYATICLLEESIEQFDGALITFTDGHFVACLPFLTQDVKYSRVKVTSLLQDVDRPDFVAGKQSVMQHTQTFVIKLVGVCTQCKEVLEDKG